MPLVDLTSENFDAETDKYAIALIDFWAPWCAPCKAFAPVFEAAAQSFPDVLFGKINTDEQVELAQQFEVRSIPTLLGVRDGTIAAVQLGAVTPAKLAAMIRELRDS